MFYYIKLFLTLRNTADEFSDKNYLY